MKVAPASDSSLLVVFGDVMSLDNHERVMSLFRALQRLNGDFATLYSQVADVDAAPTAAQVSETELALKDWNGLEAAWRGLRDGDVAELNRQLAKARLPRVRANMEPPRNLDFADEE